jgi:hypothetical protein
VELSTPRVSQFHDDAIICDFIPGMPLTQDELLRLDAASQDRLAEQLALFLGESFLRRMVRFDPTIGDALDRARFRAVAVELEWALHGVQTNDPWWWTAHIGNARDAMPMGTATLPETHGA